MVLICEGYDVEHLNEEQSGVTIYWSDGRIERVRVEQLEMGTFLKGLRHNWNQSDDTTTLNDTIP